MKLSSNNYVWLFDLDNTLHNASAAVFPAISKNMMEFMAHVLGDGVTPADHATAHALCVKYLLRYGATLKGAVNHHGVKQEDFLREAHRFDDLHSLLLIERGLNNLMQRLPGRKVLFTNAPQNYSEQVVRKMRLHKHFSEHISIETMRVHGISQPKPSKAFLLKWLKKQSLSAKNCILVEDSVSNIRAAQEVGMRTVFVNGFGPHTKQHKSISASADITVKSVFDLARQFRQLDRY